MPDPLLTEPGVTSPDALFERTADYMCTLDVLGCIQRANPAFRREVDPCSESLLLLVEPQDRELLLDALTGLTESEPTAAIDCRMADGAGSTWIHWRFTRLGSDAIMAVGRDATLRHETQGELEAKQAFLGSIIENVPECVRLIDRAGTLLDMKHVGQNMIGVGSKEEAVGLCVYDVIAEEDRERYRAFNEEVCDGARGELSFQVVAVDGTRRSMETVAVPLPHGTDGENLHLAITRDVSERLRLEEQLRQAQKMEAVGQLAGGIAHDFNNILTSIMGPAELALDRLARDDSAAQDVCQIQDAAERGARLTQQLLTFARRQVVRPTRVELDGLVDSMTEMLRRIIGDSYSLVVESSSPSASVLADRGHLEQVLLNLVVNARDAMSGGGEITVRTHEEVLSSERARELSCVPGPHVAITVTDSGHGMSPSVMERIFEPFFSTKSSGGTGIGLATCYGIVRQADGGIEVRSEEGRGSSFTVLLPSCPGEVQEAESATFAEDLGGSERILVVEDEPAVQEVVVRMLESLGYRTLTAANGSEALAVLAQDDRVPLVLTDVTMPAMNGPELAKALEERGSPIRVLYMTGYPPESLRDEGRLGGDISLLKKPFTRFGLSLAVRGALDRAKGRAAHVA